MDDAKSEIIISNIIPESDELISNAAVSTEIIAVNGIKQADQDSTVFGTIEPAQNDTREDSGLLDAPQFQIMESKTKSGKLKTNFIRFNLIKSI